ncbi:MAG: hypothetical protein QFE16_02530 [Pseudomonadota bacterium]|nr:hypothetical protein [Pseudomonadota bacterium]
MTTDTGPRRVDGLIGQVVAGPLGGGSKSERQALWIETPQGRFVLRRKDGPSFGDATLDRYLGQRVVCCGFVVGYTLLAERIEVAPA